MSIKDLSFKAIILFAFLAYSSCPAVPGQLLSITDLTVNTVNEECGKWVVQFNWSDMDEYASSVAHSDSTSGKTQVQTDALTLVSASDRSKIMKVSIIMYSQRDPSHTNMSKMATLANNTLVKSDVCQEVNLTERQIEGQKGISSRGKKCATDEAVYVAVYPIVYHSDRPNGVLASDAIGLILSTYDWEITERFLNSLKIVQIK